VNVPKLKLRSEKFDDDYDNNNNYYYLTYVKKQGYNWTKITGVNMCQNQWKQPREVR
jgi:hypothetical protein